MTQHMVAFYKSVNAAPSAMVAFTPVSDPTVTENGNLLYVPDKYNQIAFAGALCVGSAITRNQFQAPSLREMFFPEISPAVQAANFDYPDNFADWRDNPIQLQTNEGLEFYSDANNAGGGASDAFGICCFSDGKPSVQSGKIFPMYATAAVTLASGSWVSGQLTFDQTLPVGNYDIVGMRAQGTDLVACRLVFIGSSAITRPGVLANSGPTVQGQMGFRMGANGLLGTFNSITPPSVECLGSTGGTSQSFVFDLIAR